jgi:hypothetical protein
MNQSVAIQPGQPSANGSLAAAPAAGAAPPDYVLFDHTWRVTVVGLPLAVELRVLLQGALFQFQVSAEFGGTTVSRSFQVSGDVSVEIPLYVGNLVLAVSGWTASPSLASFDLLVRLTPRFTPAFTIVSQRVALSRPTQADLAAAAGGAAPQTASELLAQLQLLALSSSSGAGPGFQLPGGSAGPYGGSAMQPQPQGGALVGVQPGAGGYTPTKLAEDVIRYSSNTSITPMVTPNLYVDLGTTTVTRSGNAVVTLDPGSAGWCAFRGWVSTDLNDLRFWLHIGADFWHGGGTCRWQVYGALTPLNPT